MSDEHPQHTRLCANEHLLTASYEVEEQDCTIGFISHAPGWATRAGPNGTWIPSRNSPGTASSLYRHRPDIPRQQEDPVARASPPAPGTFSTTSKGDIPSRLTGVRSMTPFRRTACRIGTAALGERWVELSCRHDHWVCSAPEWSLRLSTLLPHEFDPLPIPSESERLRHGIAFDTLLAIEIGNGARHTQDAGVSPRAESQSLGGID